MLILLSPTKQMDFTSPLSKDWQCVTGKMEKTIPFFNAETLELNKQLALFEKEELEKLMKISPAISERTMREIGTFGRVKQKRKAALAAYSGTVFKHLAPETFSRDDILFAQAHLRILSGMYGVLKPLNEIEAYRLEMKTPLRLDNGKNLTSFWKEKVTEFLSTEEILSSRKIPILNLASNEYMKVIDKNQIHNPIITLTFKELVNGKLRTVGMYAKMARGVMVRKIIKGRIEDPIRLQTGETGGYRFNKEASSETEWIFVREQSKEME
ncbi:MAG: YaaA family protein [Spirochaetales bacterium]|nr:YaaA family protein [Spirochaetales bacterium]